MQRSIVVAVSLVAALGLLGWLLWVGTTDPTEEVAAGPVSARPEAPVERPPAEVDPPVEDAEPEPEATILTDTTAKGRASAHALQGEDALEVGLIDPSGAPVGGAEVWVLAGASNADLQAFDELDEVDAHMQARSVRHEADSAGRLRIAAPTGASTLLLASSASLWGKVRVDLGVEGPIELALEHDVTVRARVVDGGNRPVAGATVRLLQKHERWSRSARDRAADGEGAIATFRHAQRTVHPGQDRTWALGVDALLDRPVEQLIDPEALPTELVTLELPLTGSVEVRVFGEDWAVFDGQAQASLGIIRDGEPRTISPFSDINRPRTEHPVESGIAHFPFVEPGRELEVQVRRGGSQVATHAYGPGPSAAGERRSFDVRLGSDHAVAVIQAVDGGGQPLAGAALDVRVDVRAQHINTEENLQVVTDGEGRFKVDLANDWIEGTSRRLIVTKGRQSDPEASGEIDAGRELQPGLNDLGQVVLLRAALFVRGRVISPAGEPIAAAQLELRTRSSENTWWDQDRSFRHQTDDQGNFEVRGVFAGKEYLLGALKEGWAGRPRVFAAGEGRLVLEMSAEGAIEGSVLLGDGVPRDLLRLQVESPGYSVDHGEISNAELESDGSFRFGGLVAGTHEVKLGFEGISGDLYEFPGVDVRAGETTRDPRLIGIDLRGKLHVHHLRFVTAEPNAKVQGQISFGPTGAEELGGNRWFNEREVDLVTEHASLDVIVSARGYRPATLIDVQGDIEVPLEGGLRVRLRLVGNVELPAPPIYVKAVLAPLDGSHNSIDWGATPFDEGRETFVLVPSPGKMGVRWILERRSSGSSVATSAMVEPEQVVEVLDRPDQTVEVTLTPEQMQTILGALD